MFTPSPQQQDIFDAIKARKSSLIIEAVAGAGKTTTIIEACTLMKGYVNFAAYNKAIAVEIQERLQQRGSSARAGTFHSFGYGAWRRVAPKVQVDGKKMDKVMTLLSVPDMYKGFVAKAVSLAKQRAIGVLTPFNDKAAWQYIVEHYELDESLGDDLSATALEERIQEGGNWAYRSLLKSIDMDNDIVDFDDMIYSPLVHDVKMFQNDWVVVDEAQDTNPARRALAKKMLKWGGRAVFVGDPRQAIYGFTGADNDSMEIIRSEFGCQTLPLTVTYRCPKAIVAHAQQWVSHIQAHETAPEGVLQQMPRLQFDMLGADMLDKDSAVLCRLTKPLVEAAFQLIRRGIGCHVEGRDIGKSLSDLAGKWKVSTLDALQTRLEKYREREVQKFMAKGLEERAEAVSDRVETLFVIMASLPAGSKLPDLKAAIDRLFGDTPEGQRPQTLTLSTVHKAKGREWNRVYLLGRDRYMPSKFARQEWQLQQEINLIYVAVTRAKQTLIEVAA